MTKQEIDKICKENNYPHELVIITNPWCFPMEIARITNPETPEQYVQRYYQEMVNNDITQYDN